MKTNALQVGTALWNRIRARAAAAGTESAVNIPPKDSSPGRWITAFAALALVGVFAALIMLVDGRIAAWSQHLAQNAADASALAGTRSLLEITQASAFACAEASDSLVMEQIQLFADLNHVPGAASGVNVQGYYLGLLETGDYHILLHPETGQPWKVGATGRIPCEVVRGLHVEVYFPQETLLTRLFAVEHARVVVEANAAGLEDDPWRIALLENG